MERSQTMPVIKANATYEDLVAVPDDLVAEIIAGDLYVSPHPWLQRSLVTSVVAWTLGNAFHDGSAGPGGWWVLRGVEVHVRQDVLVPDISGWQRFRMPVVPDEPWMTVPPDWVCDVLSPATEQLVRVRKLRAYHDAGIAHVWLVNPATRTIEIYRRHGCGWTLVGAHGGDRIVRVEPFAALEWELSRLWGGPGESA